MVKDYQGILQSYDEEIAIYEAFAPKVSRLIRELAIQDGIDLYDTRYRVKKRGNLEKKIIRKNQKYNKLTDITDILGLRIITYFNDDVDRFIALIEREFTVDKINTVDKRNIDPDRFGYSSVHYIVSLTEKTSKLPEYTPFSELKFEIQIRSILQHAWAEIEHDLGYKTKKEIPRAIRRDFSRVSSLLELADNEFSRIKKYLEKYSDDIESKVAEETYEIAIDKISLQEYLYQSAIIKEINDEMLEHTGGTVVIENNGVISKYINSLEFFNIVTIEELDTMLKDNKQAIISFYKQWNFGEMRLFLEKDSPLLYMFYVLIYREYHEDYLRDYIKASPIEDNLTEGLVAEFNLLKERNITL
ncbi:GTP pyrophosphokinase [Salipaludibacillus daqingensis]|uniref:GTP pyrophosphokinase n=1 Tax=Salipaludibacillus daqingensis TaxID=3041001 RepID=UPI00247316FA|nr:hypothetical protein [Salipaludibacillus daqingensis]